MSIDRDGLPLFRHVTVADSGESKVLFIAGLVAEDTTKNCTDQLRDVLGTVDEIFAQVGALPAHVVSARIRLADAAEFVATSHVWDQWAQERQTPVRATIDTKVVTADFKVEIDLTAAFTPSKPRK